MSPVKLESVFKLGGANEPSSVQLKSMEWAVLTQLDGKRSVREVSEVLAMDDLEIATIVDKLLSEGVIIEIKQTIAPQAFLPPDFFDSMELNLVHLIGPVASIIIDDVLFDMNKERDQVEVEEAGTLVESVSAEIDDDTKKMQFQQSMLNTLQKY